MLKNLNAYIYASLILLTMFGSSLQAAEPLAIFHTQTDIAALATYTNKAKVSVTIESRNDESANYFYLVDVAAVEVIPRSVYTLEAIIPALGTTIMSYFRRGETRLKITETVSLPDNTNSINSFIVITPPQAIAE